MRDKRHLFEVLLQQLQIKEENILQQLEDVELERVDVIANQGDWHFYLRSPQRVHPEVYQIFHAHMLDAFQGIASIEIHWAFAQDNLDDDLLQHYWFAVYSVLGREKPIIKAALAHANFSYEAGVLAIALPGQAQLETVKGKYDALFKQRLHQVAIDNLEIKYFVDQALQNQQVEHFMELQEQAEQESLVAALEAQEKRQEQVAQEEAAADRQDIGRDIPKDAEIIPIIDLENHQYRSVTEGYIFKKELISLRSGATLCVMMITDYTSSVQVKLLSGKRIKVEQFDLYNVGDWVRLEGDMIPDNFSSELYLRPRSIRLIKKAKRQDKAPDGQKRVELHAHTQMSTLDATNSAKDIIKQAAAWGHPAVAITDHATVQAFPEAYHAAQDNNIKVIYGVEAYLVNDGEPVAYNPKEIALKEATYVVFDVETTGLSSVYDKIIELAAVKMKEGQVIDTFEAFINPNQPLSSFTTELTGITNAMVEGAPQEDVVLKDFYDFSQNTILVAHNASFDIGFLNKGYERIGIENTPIPVIDTLELSRMVNPHLKSHRLNTLAKRYGVNLEQHHRAVYDSETTGYLMYKLLDQALADFGMEYHHQLNNQLGQGDAFKQARPMHATLLVKEKDGLKDLFRLVSESNIHYYHRVPRVPRSILNKYRQHLLVGTACSEGEVFTAMMQKGYDEAKELAKYYDFIEIMPKGAYLPLLHDENIHSEKELEEIIANLYRMGKELNKPVVATGNVHYLDEKDAIYREVVQRSLKINQSRDLVLPQVHFRTTDEMLAEFAFLDEEIAYEVVVTNSQAIADSIETIKVVKDELYAPRIEGAEDEITQLTYQRAHELYGQDLPEIVEKRIEKELNSIINNGFAIMYLIAQKLVHKSNQDGYLVGSRGSVGSSLVATFTGITEVNPLAPHYHCPNCQYSEFYTQGEYGSGFDLPDKACPKCGAQLAKDGHDIPFETFLGFNGDKVPDIDLNFSGDYQAQAHAYTKVLFGEDYVYKAGTIGTVAAKTALGYVRGYIESVGHQLPQAEKERLAYGIEGVRRTTGQHPGGIIVIPDYMDVYDFTPIQYPADDSSADWRTTHFDFHSIDANVLKLDILGHDDPTVIRMLQDLSGIDPTTIPTDDADVMKLFSGTEILGVTPEQIYSDTGTLGIPEFGTNFVRGMVSETKPKTFAELLQISGLSHGTDVWLGNAQELIKNNVVPLAKVIGCRDDIMVTLIQWGMEEALAFKIMEHVRKGKGIPDDWQDKMREAKVPEWYIDSCLKIKYMFPKAHAAAYVLMALRVAYFKVHHPLYYYCAYFSVRAKDVDIVAMYQGKEMVKRRIKEINEKGNDASNKEKELIVELYIANEMLERGYHFKMVDLEKSQARNYVIEGDSLIPPFKTIPGLGASVADQIVQARSEASFLSKEDLSKRGKVSKSLIDYMTEQGIINHLPDEDQLSLF
ncbi:PolC-type DNA polymerase III [Eremococcus coleocola]|uniref:PolC-type DNA polymerase III n=1 Tax=Eremococcus coleocola TaxID=88132 RepID=UPI000427C18D|nr:PolC-type DNA polymerase III [Eremococcus coleocola]